jgi:uncharacterized membrane protein YkvA (DUF1232 family)
LKNFSEEKIYNDLPDEEETEKQIRVIDENLWAKLARYGSRISFRKDIFALYNYLKDSEVQWVRKALVVTALIYFISPLDATPDFVPLVGFLDDLGVITALIKFLGKELVPYYSSKLKAG